MSSAPPAPVEIQVAVKVNLDGVVCRLKFGLRDVGINVLESNVRFLVHGSMFL